MIVNIKTKCTKPYPTNILNIICKSFWAISVLRVWLIWEYSQCGQLGCFSPVEETPLSVLAKSCPESIYLRPPLCFMLVPKGLKSCNISMVWIASPLAKNGWFGYSSKSIKLNKKTKPKTKTHCNWSWRIWCGEQTHLVINLLTKLAWWHGTL